MLLLFNAVGLAVPASAAAEEHMIPELGTAANAVDTALVSRSAVIESSVAVAADHSFAAMAALPASPNFVFDVVASRKPVWAVVAMRTDTGDKLELEEGAP